MRLGALTLLVGVAATGTRSVWSAALYVVGAAMFCPMMMLSRYDGHDTTLLRLRRQQLLALFLLLGSAALYALEITEWGPYALRHNYWLLALSIACVLLVYSVFRIAHEEKK